jgi:hypothetical protein
MFFDTFNSSGDDSDTDGRLKHVAPDLPPLALPSKYNHDKNLPSFRIIPGSSDDDSFFSYPVPTWEQEDEADYDSPLPTKTVWMKGMRDKPLVAHGTIRKPAGTVKKRKRLSLFSDIKGPSKFAKSIQSVLDCSFDVTIRPEKLSFSEIPGSPLNVEMLRKRAPEKATDLGLRVKELEGTK